MDFTLFGHKFNVLNVVICILLGFLIASVTICSCSRVSAKQVVHKVKHHAKNAKDKVTQHLSNNN